MDATGTFQMVDRALAGIKDAMEAFIGQMSMSANLPDTIIMGMSPAGQTSGEYEKAILQKLTSIWQCLEAEPVFRQILDNFFKMQGYPGVKYVLEFDSSVENGDKEQSEIDKNTGSSIKSLAEALKVLVEAGIMTRESANEIAVLSLGEGVRPIETKELKNDPNKLPPKPKAPVAPAQKGGGASKLPT
jgi:hypothetical protein